MSTETEEKVRVILSGWIAPVVTLVISVMLAIIGFLAKDKLNTMSTTQAETMRVLNEVQKAQQSQAVDFTKYDGRLKTVEAGQDKIEKSQEITDRELTELKIDVALKQGVRL